MTDEDVRDVEPECDHSLTTEYEKVVDGGMSTILGTKCMLCGMPIPGTVRKYPN